MLAIEIGFRSLLTLTLSYTHEKKHRVNGAQENLSSLLYVLNSRYLSDIHRQQIAKQCHQTTQRKHPTTLFSFTKSQIHSNNFLFKVGVRNNHFLVNLNLTVLVIHLDY